VYRVQIWSLKPVRSRVRSKKIRRGEEGRRMKKGGKRRRMRRKKRKSGNEKEA
jgi:hypothetical protein